MAIAYFGDTSAYFGFQTLEVAVEYKVGHTTQGVCTVSSRSTAGYHVDSTHQRSREGIHVNGTALVRGYYA